MSAFTASPELLGRVCDPLTKEPLAFATEAQVAVLTAAVAAGGAKRRAGGDIPTGIDGAFLSADRRVAYPIVEGLPYLLGDEAIELDEPLPEP